MKKQQIYHPKISFYNRDYSLTTKVVAWVIEKVLNYYPGLIMCEGYDLSKIQSKSVVPVNSSMN